MHAPAPSAEFLAARAANHKAPATGWYRIVSGRGVFGYEDGDLAELTLSEGEETALMEAGHVVPAEAPSSAYRVAVEPELIEDDNEGDEPDERG